MNCCLYLCTRMIFSLARADFAPKMLGRVSKKGTPIPALMVSAGGLALATVLAISFPNSAYVYMFGIALFGGLFVWLMIFVTHLGFRRHRDPQHRIFFPARGKPKIFPVRQSDAISPVRKNAPSLSMPLFPWTTIAGGAAVLAIIISTWWVEGMRVTLESGIPWLLLLSICYFVWGRRDKPRMD